MESREWLQLLQTVMQLAGPVTDLMDLQVGVQDVLMRTIQWIVSVVDSSTK